MGGISIWQLLIIVVIVALLFGTKKLSSLGADLGTSIKGFKKAMSEGDGPEHSSNALQQDADFGQSSLSGPYENASQDSVKPGCKNEQV